MCTPNMGVMWSKLPCVSAIQSQRPILFTTLGLVVLDELHFPNGEMRKDLVGGSGAYSQLFLGVKQRFYAPTKESWDQVS